VVLFSTESIKKQFFSTLMLLVVCATLSSFFWLGTLLPTFQPLRKIAASWLASVLFSFAAGY